MNFFTFIIETIDFIDRLAFMVASQQEEVFWILYFVSHQETDALNRMFSSIDIISQKQVVGITREPSILKELY